MTVAFEAGYTLPGGDLALNHARILHRGNRFMPRSVTASATATGSDGSEPNEPMTYEAWKPFDNSVPQPIDFGDAAWTLTNATVAADGQTLSETAATGEHSINDTATLTAVEWVFGVLVTRETVPEIRLRVNDGTTTFACYFDLRDGTVGTAAGGAAGVIVDLGDGTFYCSIRFTPAAAASTFGVYTSNGSETVSFAGSTTNTVKLLRADLNPSAATWDFETFTASAGDVFCVAGHNLGSRGGRLQFSYGASPTLIGSVSPTSDAPIMFIHEGQTSADWRVTVDRAGGPEIAVIRIGKLLQMERPFFGGHAPSHRARKTRTAGTKSEGGQFLGRAIVSHGLAAQYSWNNLTDTWARANLDGRNGLIRAVELEPFFIAWRSSEFQDCDYAWTMGPVEGPAYSGDTNRLPFTIQGEALGYEF